MEAMRWVALATVVAGGACGRIDFDPLGTNDAAGGGSDAGACLGTGTFSNVQPVTAINNSDTQYGTFFAPDGLSLLWDQPSGTHQALFITQRSTRSDAFPAGALVPGTFPDGNASDGSLTADLLELYFASDVTGNLCVYRATRASTAVGFDPPVKLDALCTGIDTTGPAISADGLTLVYNSALDAAAEGDLYVTVRADRTADFTVGKKLANLPTGIGYPWLSQDRLRIWFEHETGTGLELESAQRISPSDDFSSVHAIAELNTGTENGDAGLTLDESEIVFASTRGGNYDVYIASRPCL
jgi:hypothetical protein